MCETKGVTRDPSRGTTDDLDDVTEGIDCPTFSYDDLICDFRRRLSCDRKSLDSITFDKSSNFDRLKQGEVGIIIVSFS